MMNNKQKSSFIVHHSAFLLPLTPAYALSSAFACLRDFFRLPSSPDSFDEARRAVAFADVSDFFFSVALDLAAPRERLFFGAGAESSGEEVSPIGGATSSLAG
jgi:hypothetical protein